MRSASCLVIAAPDTSTAGRGKRRYRGHEMGIGKTFFLSYAQADAPLPTRLLDLLQPRLAIMKGVDCDAGLDTMIPVGTDWRREIDQALDRCDFGLLLLSPGFFAGRFIFGQELPRLLGLGPDGGISIRKPIVPVGIEAVSLDGSADLKGLDRT